MGKVLFRDQRSLTPRKTCPQMILRNYMRYVGVVNVKMHRIFSSIRQIIKATNEY